MSPTPPMPRNVSDRRRARSRLTWRSLGLSVGLCAGLTGAAADEARKDGVAPDSIANILPQNGDPGGGRKWLAERGVTYNVILTTEGLSNLAGGVRRGSVLQGRLEAQLTADLETMLGAKGLSFYANAFQVHGTGAIAAELVGSLNTISNIEALPSTRLSEVWFEQKLFGDTASLRFGQLAVDTEFFISDVSALFMNSDWPAITKHNLPNGGPAYPFSTPGVRLKFEPTPQTAMLVALYNGDPAGSGGDPELRNHYGLNFRVNDPPLLMAEWQYRANQGKSDRGLARTVKLGGWHHFGTFESQRFDADGRSLADPLSSGIAARLRGTSGAYAVIDQQIYRPAGAAPDGGIGVFGRIAAAPSDRNPVDFYLDGGVVFSGLVPGRPDDKFGVTALYTNVSRALRALDRDNLAFGGPARPLRDYELSLAFAYQAQIVTGWTLQPELQYIVHPGGHVADPGAAVPGAAVRNATVVALRSVVKY